MLNEKLEDVLGLRYKRSHSNMYDLTSRHNAKSITTIMSR